MRNDKELKTAATKAEKCRVYEYMNTPKDILAECSDGIYERRVWRNPNGNFGWGPWKKVQ